MAKTESADARRIWDSALAEWRDDRPTAFLRAYSDAVNYSLLDAWLVGGQQGRVLKTDLFDEAVGRGLVPELRNRSTEVVAVDVSPAVVRLARTRYPDLDAHAADTRQLPFADASFDVVVSNSTLDHFDRHEEIARALRELHRVLKPQGRLLLTLDNAANPLIRLRNALPTRLVRGARLVPYPVGATCGPLGLRRLLRDCGFEVEEEQALMHCPRVLARAAAALLPLESRRLLRGVMSLERLGAAPTRYLTGQFVAASAHKRLLADRPSAA
jgi:SAM-dependent methyltransferase